MKKIIILGCENSHATQFLTYLNDNEKYAEIDVLGCHSYDEEAKNSLAKSFNIRPLVSFDEISSDLVDGVIVTARHGNFHLKFAKPYLVNGKTLFIDKPITIDENDALELAHLAKENNVKLVGGSSLSLDGSILKMKELFKQGKSIGGFVRAPISMNNVYGGFYFYAEHLVDIVLTIFGYFPLEVAAKESKDTITVNFNYGSYIVQGIYGKDNYIYSVGLFNQNETIVENIIVDGNAKCFEIHLREFYDVLNSSENHTDYAQFIAPVFVLNAIKRSLESGTIETVHKINL